MNIQNGAYALTGSAWPNSAARYLFNRAPSGSDPVLMLMLEVLLWT
jgi:hypothetical protein